MDLSLSYVYAYTHAPQTEASVSSHQLFSTVATGGGGDPTVCDSLGDLAVKTLSEMVLNEQPAQDHRWGETRGWNNYIHFV